VVSRGFLHQHLTYLIEQSSQAKLVIGSKRVKGDLLDLLLQFAGDSKGYELPKEPVECIFDFARCVTKPSCEFVTNVPLFKTTNGSDVVDEGIYRTFRQAETSEEWVALYYFIICVSVMISEELSNVRGQLRESCSRAVNALVSEAGISIPDLFELAFQKRPSAEAAVLSSFIRMAQRRSSSDGYVADSKSHQIGAAARLNVLYRIASRNWNLLLADKEFSKVKLTVHGLSDASARDIRTRDTRTSKVLTLDEYNALADAEFF
jgi:hypothetical protein